MPFDSPTPPHSTTKGLRTLSPGSYLTSYSIVFSLSVSALYTLSKVFTPCQAFPGPRAFSGILGIWTPTRAPSPPHTHTHRLVLGVNPVMPGPASRVHTWAGSRQARARTPGAFLGSPCPCYPPHPSDWQLLAFPPLVWEFQAWEAIGSSLALFQDSSICIQKGQLLGTALRGGGVSSQVKQNCGKSHDFFFSILPPPPLA